MSAAERLGATAPGRRLAPGPAPVIETERLRLRAHRMDDAEAIAQSLGDYQVARMLARVPVPYDRQDAASWLVRQTSGLAPDWTFAITAGDDVHIGVVSIERRLPGQGGLWHLGYWLNRYYWGKGFAREAAHAALERFFRRMPEAEIHSGVFVDNPASLRVQQALGFAITGCAEVYSVSRGAMVGHIETALSAPMLRKP